MGAVHKKLNKKAGEVVNLHNEEAYRFLNSHRAKQAFIKVDYDNGESLIVNAFKKGNVSYDLYTSKRFKELAEALHHHIEVKAGYTNAIFDTLTLPCKSIEHNHWSWQSISKMLENYFYQLKKVCSIKHYIVTLEATEQGQVHAHIIIILNEQIAYKKHNGKPFFRSQARFKQIQDCWKYGHSKPIPIYNAGGAVWELAKYALKGNRNLNTSMERYRKGKHTPSDIKKINLFYYSIKHRIRTLRTSKGILDYICNKSENSNIKALTANKLSSEDVEVIETVEQHQQEQKKIVKISMLSEKDKHRIRFIKNGEFTPVDWNKTLALRVNWKNEILEQIEYKQARKG